VNGDIGRRAGVGISKEVGMNRLMLCLLYPIAYVLLYLAPRSVAGWLGFPGDDGPRALLLLVFFGLTLAASF
jgi:hypothetical protein